jgi:hypothetical protein
MLEKEYDALREELRSLKSCQIIFLNISITSSGLLIGLNQIFEVNKEVHIIFLAPLIIIIPSWLIFFDKATTITRIVGYFRILENFLILNDKRVTIIEKLKYIGWENSLSKYRSWKYKETEKKISTHKYWLLTWTTFMLLGFICITLSSLFHIEQKRWPFVEKMSDMDLIYFILIVLSSIVFVTSFIITARIVYQLIKGCYSYEYNENKWINILEE